MGSTVFAKNTSVDLSVKVQKNVCRCQMCLTDQKASLSMSHVLFLLYFPLVDFQVFCQVAVLSERFITGSALV